MNSPDSWNWWVMEKFWWGHLLQNFYLGHREDDGKITLRWILDGYGWNLLSIVSNGGLQ